MGTPTPPWTILDIGRTTKDGPQRAAELVALQADLRPDASLDALKAEVEAEEARADAMQRDCETAEAELAELKSQKAAADDELEGVRAQLKGGKKADLKAQKLHALARQKAQLELLLDNAHRSLAQSLDEVENEKVRFNQLLMAAG